MYPTGHTEQQDGAGKLQGKTLESGRERLNLLDIRLQEYDALHIILCCIRTAEANIISFTVSYASH